MSARAGKGLKAVKDCDRRANKTEWKKFNEELVAQDDDKQKVYNDLGKKEKTKFRLVPRNAKNS